MCGLLKRLFRKLRETKWFYKLFNTNIRVIQGGSCFISSTATLKNSNIYVGPNSSLSIGDNVCIDGIGIYVYEGVLDIQHDSILERSKNAHVPEYIVDGGAVVFISDHVRLRCQRLWSRFQGRLTIGSYTNINDFSEVRCDELVSIGSYCRISYNTRIWDTNTHNIIPSSDLKELTRKMFPRFGDELSRPITKPVYIGDSCWLGEGVAILKGTRLENDVIIGFRTLVSNKEISQGKTVISKVDLSIF